LLLGVGAWLLGATSATVGSLYAVGQLGNSLLAVPSRQMSVAMVNADLAHQSSQQAQPLGTAPPLNVERRGGLGDSDHAARGKKTRVAPSQSPSPEPSSPTGVLLTSPDGSADAVCGTGGAYLLYWSPQPGFEADDVVRGPALVASVVFRSPGSGIRLRVSCAGGVPVKRLVNVGWHDE
jgi:hypothetical protein